MTLPSTYKQYIFDERPTEHLTPTTFKCETKSTSDLKVGPGQVLIKVTWISLDPAMRSWLNDSKRAYAPPVKLGEVMRATGLGVVVQVGEGSTFSVGDEVSGLVGWREYIILDDKFVTKLPNIPGAQALDFIGPLGHVGMTAYFGLFDIGKIKAGETLFVSGAAGAVGSVTCQIGKIMGLKVVAIAGSDDKVEWLKKEIGVDVGINYKAPDFKEQVVAAGFADVYFDNVGGDMLNLMMTRMTMKGRIVLCGAISDYNSKPKGLTNYTSLIAQRARIEGFVVMDYTKEYPVAMKAITEWIEKGLLKRKFHIVNGIDAAPSALPLLYTGGNTGKLVVKVSEHETTSKL